MKYAGGKRRLVPEILPLLPHPPSRYVEPFVGGGAVFLAREAGPALICDANPTVAAVWRGVQNDPNGVLDTFYRHADQDNRPYYFRTRKARPKSGDGEIAGWFLYLNKAGFNGLWRENQKGDMNVPYGDGRTPRIDEWSLWGAHDQLQGVEVVCGDFEALEVQLGDVIYCDPPYLPASKTASFTAYTRQGFSPSDQIRLAQWCRSSADRGAYVVLSNSGTRDSLTAFNDLADDAIETQAARVISCKGDGRQPVKEYLFTFCP